MYLPVLWKCDIIFDADSRNGIHISYKKATLNQGNFKEIVKGDKKYSSYLQSWIIPVILKHIE